MKRLVSILTLLTVFLLLALHSRPAAAQNHNVVVPLFDVQNRNVGTATLSDGAGGMMVEITVRDMLPIPGDRALMVHAVSNCTPPNYSAGVGAMVAMLPAVQFYSSGGADYRQVVTNVTLGSLMDRDGSALVLHEDVAPDPKGIIICGEIPTGTGTTAPTAPTAVPAQPTTAPALPTSVPAAPTTAPAAPTMVPAPAPATATPVPPAPSVPPAPPTGAQNVQCRMQGNAEICAWVSNANPARGSEVTVSGRLLVGGVPQAGRTMTAVWRYRSSTPTCSGVTNNAGIASCFRDISTATAGFVVNIDVTIDGRTVTTAFAPQ